MRYYRVKSGVVATIGEVDGVEITEAEYLAEIDILKEGSAERAEAIEKHRPLTESEIVSMLVKAQINTLDVDDQTANRMKFYYPAFDDLCDKSYTAENVGYKFTYGEDLYKTKQAKYTFVTHYKPGVGTESLFERIDEVHDGSKYDPIPYEGNMALESGKYYTQGDVLYLCNRDTVNPVYNTLSELVGLYVEIV